MPTAIAIAVVEHEGQFLIGQRPPGVPLAGLWEFPGGKMDPGETPEAAAERECLEETGLRVEPFARYPDVGQAYEHGSVELHFVACRVVGGIAAPPPFRWVAREQLMQYEFPEGNRGLLQLLTSGPQRPSGSTATPQRAE
jgi:8-oxo-dGTP diphosphatase